MSNIELTKAFDTVEHDEMRVNIDEMGVRVTVVAETTGANTTIFVAHTDFETLIDLHGSYIVAAEAAEKGRTP